MSSILTSEKHQLELEDTLLKILKELKLIRLMVAEANRSSLREDEVDV